MPSPFPGMDPYIESSDRWGSFHTLMIAAMCGYLNARLPQRFVASVEEYVLVHQPEAKKRVRHLEPDAYVSERGLALESAVEATTLTAPQLIVLPAYRRKKRRNLEIIDRDLRRVVTAIELLSPSNKTAGEDRKAYLRKRNDYMAAWVSMVELDLLRDGQRLPLSDPPPNMRDYYMMVCPAWQYPQASVWTFGIREAIPVVPVPLVEDVPALPLDLRPCLDRVYDEARLATELHYDQLLTPRLPKRDAAWVRELLAARKT